MGLKVPNDWLGLDWQKVILLLQIKHHTCMIIPGKVGESGSHSKYKVT